MSTSNVNGVRSSYLKYNNTNCSCGHLAAVRICTSALHPNRLYQGCASFPRECSFFQWCEPIGEVPTPTPLLGMETRQEDLPLFNKLRQQYVSFKKLLETTGFRWNANNKTAIVDESLWEVHIKDNPSWAKFRRYGLPEWEDLCKIFGGTYTMGDTALQPSVDLSRDNEESVGDCISDEDDINITSNDNPEMSPTPQLHTPTGPVPLTERHDTTPNVKRRKRKNTGPEFSNSRAIHSFSEMCLAKWAYQAQNIATSKDNNDFSIAKTITVLMTMNLDNPMLCKAILYVKSDPRFREVLISSPPEVRHIFLESMLESTQPPVQPPQ